MSTHRRLTVLSLSLGLSLSLTLTLTLTLGLALLPTRALAQTSYTTSAPTEGLTPEGPTAERPTAERPTAAVSAGAFATAVVVEDGEIFVGRPGEFAFFPIPPNHAGTVHVFGLDDGGAWEETAMLSSESVEVGDGFGAALAVDGNTVLVGAPMTRGARGAAYVFRRPRAGAPWGPVTILRIAIRSAGD